MENDDDDIPQVDIDLVVTDLDNTLYDWVRYFTAAFYRMVKVASVRLCVSETRLLDELQEVHRKHHDSEHPYSLLETPTVEQRFPGLSSGERASALDDAFHEFNRVRDATLKLYDGVSNALCVMAKIGVPVVGHTEATVPNAVFRLRKLGVEKFLVALYAWAGSGEGYFDANRAKDFLKTSVPVRPLRRDERKPDPRVVLDICRDFGVPASRTLYIGDSLARDVGMAKSAGAWAAWAKYGTKYDSTFWRKLTRITHWTDEDVRRVEEAQRRLGGVRPDVVLENSMEEVLIPPKGTKVRFRFRRTQSGALLRASMTS